MNKKKMKNKRRIKMIFNYRDTQTERKKNLNSENVCFYEE